MQVRAGLAWCGLMWRHLAADALMVSRPRQLTAFWDRDGWHAVRMALPVWFQRVESAAVAALVVVAFVQLGFAWWWLLAVFLLWDLSMVGYLASPRLGAITYNLGHSYFGPAVLLAITWVGDAHWPAFVALTWAFHIAVDRLLGYGLKFTDRFNHTHLGEIGQERHGAPAT